EEGCQGRLAAASLADKATFIGRDCSTCIDWRDRHQLRARLYSNSSHYLMASRERRRVAPGSASVSPSPCQQLVLPAGEPRGVHHHGDAAGVVQHRGEDRVEAAERARDEPERVHPYGETVVLP